MSNCNKIKKEDIDENKGEDNIDDPKKKNLELFRLALTEGINRRSDKMLNELPDELKEIEASKQHKLRMNSIFRECIGDSFILFPEETED